MLTRRAFRWLCCCSVCPLLLYSNVSCWEAFCFSMYGIHMHTFQLVMILTILHDFHGIKRICLRVTLDTSTRLCGEASRRVCVCLCRLSIQYLDISTMTLGRSQMKDNRQGTGVAPRLVHALDFYTAYRRIQPPNRFSIFIEFCSLTLLINAFSAEGCR